MYNVILISAISLLVLRVVYCMLGTSSASTFKITHIAVQLHRVNVLPERFTFNMSWKALTLWSCLSLITVPTSEEERLWGLVRDNAADFNAWTELIQETEKSVGLLMSSLSL